MLPGRRASLAWRRAPLASWISLILLPDLPMTEPMRALGMMKLVERARGVSVAGEEGGREGEPDSDGARARDGRNVKGLVVDATHDKSKGLRDRRRKHSQLSSPAHPAHPERTLLTASSCPPMTMTRSGFPGTASVMVILLPLFSLISFTFFPPLPMMMEASWVTMRARIWMTAAAAAAASAAAADPSVVAEGLAGRSESTFMGVAPSFEAEASGFASSVCMGAGASPSSFDSFGASTVAATSATGLESSSTVDRLEGPEGSRLDFLGRGESAPGEEDLERLRMSSLAAGAVDSDMAKGRGEAEGRKGGKGEKVRRVTRAKERERERCD